MPEENERRPGAQGGGRDEGTPKPKPLLPFAGSDDDRLHLVMGESKQTKHWRRRTATWADFVAYQSNPGPTKEARGGYVPVALRKTTNTKSRGCRVGADGLDDLSQPEIRDHVGYHRTIEGVEFASLITLDNDGATEDFLDRLRALGLAGLWHVTNSHEPDWGLLKYRVLIRVSRPMTGAEKGCATRWLMRQLDGQDWDKTCASPEHFMYWSSVPKGGAPFEIEEMTGALLDVDEASLLGDLGDARGERYAPRRRGESVPVDISDPASPEERARALETLEEEAEKIRDLDQRTPVMFPVLIEMYRLVLGGCLTREEVDEAICDAYTDNGNDSQTEHHFNEQKDNAWDLAEGNGPLRPVVESLVDDAFDVLPDEARPTKRDPSYAERQALRHLENAVLNAAPGKRAGMLRWAKRKARQQGIPQQAIRDAFAATTKMMEKKSNG